MPRVVRVVHSFSDNFNVFHAGRGSWAESWLLPELGPDTSPCSTCLVRSRDRAGVSVLHKREAAPRSAAITFTNELGFIRRYGAELGLVLGVISLILTIYSLL